MGRDKMRHVVRRKGRYYWIPSKTLKALGYSCEPLGPDPVKAHQRAAYLNGEADKDRANGRAGQAQILPADAISRMIDAFERSPEYERLKPRTKRDYRMWLARLSETFGKFSVADLRSKVIKTYLIQLARESEWNAYHIGLMIRVFLKWCATENLIEACPTFEVPKPPSRTVKWHEAEIWKVIEQLKADGRRSMAVGLLVEWCIGQNPCDVWDIKCKAYENGALTVVRAKTGIGADHDPIPLWPDVRAELDAYLAERPAVGDAPLIRNEVTGQAWKESSRAKVFAQARAKAGLRKELQMRDLRRTAITETLKLGFTRGQARALSRHATEQGMEPYDVLHSSGIVVEIQRKRHEARTQKRSDS